MKNLICAVTVLAVSSAQAGVVIHVDVGNCPGPGSGSVRDPYCSIQTAIDNAVDTEEIVVASGTYFETINFLGKAIALRSSDGPDVTIIDAQGAGTVVICESGEALDTVLEGFTITGGAAFLGGGMLNHGSSPTVTLCVFASNTALEAPPGTWHAGGGMANFDGSCPIVTDCVFIGNTATGGGAGMANIIYSDPTVSDCLFIENLGLRPAGNVSRGGGMYSVVASDPIVTGCTFEGNSADRGGGMHMAGSTMVSRCIFTGNAASDGGAIYVGFSHAQPIVAACSFVANEADRGGGIFDVDSSLMIVNCVFGANSAGHFGGGLFSLRGGPLVTNCTFFGNAAGVMGGAVSRLDLPPMTPQSTASPALRNCVLWGNSPDQIFPIGAITVRHCVVQGGWPFGPGNIDADPIFADPDNGNFRLSAGSPSIDAGDNSAVPEGTTTDLAGNPRFIDDPDTPDCQQAPGQCGDPPVVDMGAYELRLCPWDLDGDNTVGILDFLALLAAWGPNPGHPADIDGDGLVGIIDFLLLLANWGPCP